MNTRAKAICLFSALMLFSRIGFAGTAKTGGGYEALFDAVAGAGMTPVSGGGYVVYQSVAQAAGFETASDNTYTVVGGFLGVVDETPPAVSFGSPAAGSSAGGTINVAGTAMDENGVQWTLYYGAGSAPATWNAITGGAANVSGQTIASWDASALSGAYSLKIVAVDGRGNTAEGTVTFTVGNTVTVTGTIPKFKWMLVSMPVRPAAAAPTSIYGLNYEYKVYRWNPAKAPVEDLGRYEYPALLSAGDGYWVKVYDVDMPYSFAGTLVDTTTDYSVAAKEGWNQMGAPFNGDFEWGAAKVRYNGATYDLSSAAAAGLLSSTITGYDGDARSWTQHDAAATMEKGKGYSVRAYKDVELLFNPNAGAGRVTGRIVRNPFDYRVKISAKGANAADVDNFFGAAAAASKDFDQYDLEEPHRTPDDKYVSLYFTRDGSREAARSANDIRASLRQAGETEGWDFNVETNDAGAVTLTWDNTALPAGYSFTLVNLDTGERVDMAAQGSHTYTVSATARFRIEVVKLETPKVTKSYTLGPGWNLISVPVEPEVTSALAQLGDDLPLLNVYQYHEGVYYAAEAADIQAGVGYWVHVADNAEIDIEGVPPAAEVRVPLARGWNIIGNPFEAPLAWGDNIRFACAGADYTLAQAVAAGVTDGRLYEFDGAAYAPVAALQPWRGYFAKAAAECELVLEKQ